MPPLLVGLGFGDRAVRRFVERMNASGRYHVFRSGTRYYLNGVLIVEGPYRKRGHMAAGAWIERDAQGRVAAEDVVCFDDLVPEDHILQLAKRIVAHSPLGLASSDVRGDLPRVGNLGTA